MALRRNERQEENEVLEVFRGEGLEQARLPKIFRQF